MAYIKKKKKIQLLTIFNEETELIRLLPTRQFLSRYWAVKNVMVHRVRLLLSFGHNYRTSLISQSVIV